ncbi:MAG: hypothetical protein M3R69_03940 [Acidobacteriota bacterium]|nr:hypothetical protein [Acidobacteriota bacterium]
MITGFNTDIEHDGVVYHVQTEDKGVNSPLILSLVYSGGEILASKRSRYEDLIASGFKEEVLAERLKRQHRLICAAINAGRIEDLKRMGPRDGRPASEPFSATDAELLSRSVLAEPTLVTPPEVLQREAQAEDAVVPPTEEVLPLIAEEPAESRESKDSRHTVYAAVIPAGDDLPGSAEEPQESKKFVELDESAYTVYDSRRTSPMGELETAEHGLVLSMIDEAEFRAGETFTIRILVQKQWKEKVKPIAGAALSVKILGTTFRPKIYAVKSGKDGIAELSIEIPSFTSGRAAILVRAAVDGDSKEMRRVINPAT